MRKTRADCYPKNLIITKRAKDIIRKTDKEYKQAQEELRDSFKYVIYQSYLREPNRGILKWSIESYGGITIASFDSLKECKLFCNKYKLDYSIEYRSIYAY